MDKINNKAKAEMKTIKAGKKGKASKRLEEGKEKKEKVRSNLMKQNRNMCVGVRQVQGCLVLQKVQKV
jgi:vacuolar-type H+-ATPase subunit E/Vma4